MKPSCFILATTLASVSFLPAVRSQTPTPAPKSTGAVTVSGPTDRLSSSTTRAVAAGIPFKDPNPKPVVEAKPAEPAEEEGPRNGIVRLPKMVVEGNRPPIFRERDINTTKGLAAIAVDRYFSETAKALNRYTLPLFGGGAQQAAMMMYEDDERVKNLQDANQSIYILRQTDSRAADQMQDEVDRTFLRKSDALPAINLRGK